MQLSYITKHEIEYGNKEYVNKRQQPDERADKSQRHLMGLQCSQKSRTLNANV